jgi:hypothetical protein
MVAAGKRNARNEVSGEFFISGADAAEALEH